MQLNEAGESRLRGYLFVLERALRTFLPTAEAMDAAREVESHLRDRLAEVEPLPDERAALERIIDELGSPLAVARAYSLEVAAEQAVVTGRLVAVGRSLMHMAALGIGGFFATIFLFVGYVTGVACLAIALLEPLFPQNVGIWMVDGIPLTFGARFPPPDGAVLIGGYWVIGVAALLGITILVITHILARRLIGRWLRRRRESAALLSRRG